ncbi:Uncharacterized protein Yba3 [Buchnera aphidicola (Cinara kochiana kochiana)]|uniref:Uncharacterized protein Yba3, partial n=1 Tax=Buchnera aphidicola (Cinara kochiana kochiana) TaxID=2518976 RepID=A0A451D6E8_9GAMM|nr:hypothetical protein [Buchnera aphidicola]VFP81284.1 Uncharacterized protein Yba3 [Buchnera aphidicola (Cinara kochiana kochiana)]
MSSVSSIRSNIHLNSKIIKKVDNGSVLNNKNLKNVNVAIINDANQEYIAHIIPKNKYDKESFIYSDENSSCESKCDEKSFNIIDSVSAEEYCNNSMSESDSNNILQCSPIHDRVKDLFLKIFNNSRVDWHVLHSVNFSNKTALFSKKLQQSFKKLTKTGQLEQKFLDNIDNKTVFLNGQKIPSNQAPDIMNIFQTSITDYESQQLISTYLHPEILDAAWNNLSYRYPEVEYRTSNNIRFAYEIDEISPGIYKVAVTKTADLQSSYSDNIDEINQYGVRAAMIIAKDSNPEVKYSFFVQ